MNRLDCIMQGVLESLWRKASDKATRYGFKQGCRDRDAGMAFNGKLPNDIHQSFAPAYTRGYVVGYYGLDNEPEF